MTAILPPSDYKYLSLLKLSPFERHPRGGWRFGTRRIADSVVERMVACRRATIDTGQVRILEAAP